MDIDISSLFKKCNLMVITGFAHSVDANKFPLFYEVLFLGLLKLMSVNIAEAHRSCR